ncbi:MAG TPA: diguanylate cyclase [Gemmatimonadaceae bacterium]|nr:diguanylate cyclase [Gemmatimonadaceae bacterium]
MLTVRAERRAVPKHALLISLAALVVPVAVVFWLPDWTSNGLGMLIWLSALIPAFLLAYYRGLAGVAAALAGGMAVITATQISVVSFGIAEPNWGLLLAIVAVYLLVAIGVAVLAELLQRERRNAEELALVDRLTGLPNRRHAEIALETECAAAERGRKFAVAILDLDRFKQVNDRFGHPAGDLVIATFGKILQQNTRKENVSARYGGEEFVCLMRDTDLDEAVLFAQRILDRMREAAFPWGSQTVSAGVAEYEPGMGSYEVLLGAADRALYRAKEGGRDMVASAPRRGDPAVAPAADGSAQGPAHGPAHGPARLYLVDDDAAVRSVLKRLLVHAGYEVWDSGSPREAIARFAAAAPADRPDAIVSDIIMPEMTGVRMIDEIAKTSTDIRVVYMSGYVHSSISWAGSPGKVVKFLDKPVSREKLLDTLTDALR